MANSQKIFENRFNGGLVKDLDDKLKDPSTYTEGYHISIARGEKFGSIQNMRGTSLLANILTSHDSYNLMGVQNVRAYIVSSGVEDCVLFYTTAKDDVGPVYTFYIHLLRVSTSTVYKVYEETVTSSYMTASVDSLVSSEGGVDTVYFTSEVFEPRRIRCYFNTSSPTKTSREIELWRRYPRHPLTISNIIYNPKGNSVVGSSHAIYIGNGAYIQNTSTNKEYDADFLLDVDTGFGESFTFELYWSINQQVEADGATQVYTRIDVKNQAGASVSGFPKTNTLGASTSPPSTAFYSTSGTEYLTSADGAYNSQPYSFIIDVEVLNGTGNYLVKGDVSIRNISRNNGDDSYSVGSPTSRTEQLNS